IFFCPTRIVSFGAYEAGNFYSDPISWKFLRKYKHFACNFLYVGIKYSPDPEFCVFLGLGTNFVCCRYKRHLKCPVLP
ncbi:MAG: hypothetical protein PUK34_01310, partial [Clostridia bacterium]|nr:hypothetical protein [Clostridia bacterium]